LNPSVTWDDAAVETAFADWLWVPPGTEVHDLPGARLLVRPAWLSHRSFTVGTPPVGREDEAIGAALELGRQAGLPSVRWALPERPENEDFAATLRRRGATVAETLDRLAWEPRELPAPHPEVVVLPVLDELGVRAVARVDEIAFGDAHVTDDRVPELLEECVSDFSRRLGGRFVAWVDGEGVGDGGLSMAGDVARLWGGATLPHARRKGVYSAVLAERLRVAVGWGATIALVKGRIDTSAPILRRFGFRAHGREVAYDVPV
jgi:GNAT superfamily N-acetyltransferase